jgi:hypothetical protein
MIKNPNMQRIRIEGGHAWTLKARHDQGALQNAKPAGLSIQAAEARS